ncbi:hypothetical protein PFISCL1PPCAC_21499, partial [Pristionchus fissidentatus]
IRMNSLPERHRRCELCHADDPLVPCDTNSSLPSQSHLLACGHVLCNRCRSDNAISSEKVWCQSCRRFSLTSILSATTAAKSRTTSTRCTLHGNRVAEFQCPCGKVICHACAVSTHSDHFQYEELFVNKGKMTDEIRRLTRIKKLLTAEKEATEKKRRIIEDNIL